MIRKLRVFIFFLCLTAFTAQSQTDDCASSPSINVETTCINTAYSVPSGFVDSGIALSCAGTVYKDGWFTFTTGTGTTEISIIGSSNKALGLAVYNGSCGTPVEISCTIPNTANASLTNITVSPSTTYYLRIMRTSTGGGAMTGDICIQDTTPCNTPTVTSASAITSTTATINWIAISPAPVGGYEYIVSTDNVTTTSGDDQTGTTAGLFTNITGLTASTTYYVFVRSDCSGSFSTWDGPVSFTTTAVPPPNDECINAVSLIVNADENCGTVTAGTVLGATDSGIVGSGCGGNDDDDVWFSFVANATVQTVTLINIAGSSSDMYHVVYDGLSGCGSLGAALICSDSNSSTVPGLTIGNTYYVQVYTWTGTAGQTSTFDICIGTPPPPPANDECTGAIAVLTNPDQSCANFASGTVEDATNSGVGNGTCGGTEDDDVWFSFVATSTTHTFDLNITFGTTDLYHAIYGGPCGTLGASLLCSDPNSSILNGLTIGNTYYVQVYSWSSASQVSIFDLCIGSPPPPPPNDECAGAIAILTNPDFNCTNFGSGTIYSATDSGEDNCLGTEDDDVWFSFTATSTAHTFDLINITGSTTDLYHVIYDGACGSLGVPLLCSDPESSALSGLTIGNTYIVQVYSDTATIGQTSSFNLCIGTPPPPPGNDSCSTATTLACATTNLAGTTVSTLDTPHGTGCSMSNYGVWYTFVGDGDSTTISTTASGGFDHEMSITSGSCGSLVNIDCIDFGFTNGTESYTFDTTLGTTYFVYVAHWLSGSSTTGNFTISRTCSPPSCQTNPLNPMDSCGIIAGGVGLNGVDPPAITCGAAASVDLEAEYLDVGDTTDYTVEPITYNPPIAFSGLANLISVNQDDRWSPIIDFPASFDFCFYGNNYNQCLVGSNGNLTFDTVNNTPGGFSNWSYNENLPSTNGDLISNTIFGVFQDIDPSVGGEIGWELTSLPNGCRALVVAWHDVPMFSNNSLLYTGMMVLYEKTNIIEIYIEEKNTVAGWNNGNGLVGIQNDDASQARIPCGRNGLDANWTTTNEAWRFTPSGGTSIATLQWYEGSISAGNEIGAPNENPITVSPTSTTTYYAQVTYSAPCNSTDLYVADFTTVTLSASKTWNGSVSNDWNVSNNWTPNGVPTSSDCVLIPDVATDPIFLDLSPPLPPNPGFAKSITVEAFGNLEIAFESTIEVTEGIIVDPDGIFNILDGGSLVQINDAGVNSGNIRMERTVTGLTSDDYVYWSSPVENFEVTNISPGTATNFIWEWIPTVIGNGVGNHGGWQNTIENMIQGKGYIVKDVVGTAQTATPLFLGVANNGVITIPIFRGTYSGGVYAGLGDLPATAQDDNWNLIGNPYPSAIAYTDFIAANSYIEGTIYLWTHQSPPSNAIGSSFYEDFVYNYNPNDYIAFNLTGSTPLGFNGSIGAGQSFFVEMLDNATTTETVTFNNSMRDPANDNMQFYSPYPNNGVSVNDNPIEKHRIWLDLIAPGNLAHSILVGYVDGATNGDDRLYDGYEFSGAFISFYSLMEDVELSIQGRSLPFDELDTVPLGMVIPINETYRIAINTVDGLFENEEQSILLEDTYTNSIHDLRISPYSFTSEPGTFNDRFILRYSSDTLGTDDVSDLSDITIISNDHGIQISSRNNPIDSVTIYDLLGRVIIDVYDLNTMYHSFENLQLSKGAYIVRATSYNGRQKIKKVVN